MFKLARIIYFDNWLSAIELNVVPLAAVDIVDCSDGFNSDEVREGLGSTGSGITRRPGIRSSKFMKKLGVMFIINWRHLDNLPKVLILGGIVCKYSWTLLQKRFLAVATSSFGFFPSFTILWHISQNPLILSKIRHLHDTENKNLKSSNEPKQNKMGRIKV